jgi:hypothetical protein
MNLFKRLFAPAPRQSGRQMDEITVRCQRCGEIITAPLDLRNDLSADYDENTGATSYVCRKLLMGKQRCFQSIEVTLRFDADKKLIDRQIQGGTVVENNG